MVNYHRVGCESTLFSISLTFEQQLVHANRVRILVTGGQVRNKLCSRHAQMFTGPLPLSRDAIEQRRSAIISEGKLSTTRRFRKRVPPRRRSERFDCWNVTVTLPPVSSSPFRSSSCLSSIIERISKDSRLPLSFRRNTVETVKDRRIEIVNCVRDPLGYKSRYAICFLTGTLNDLKAYLAWGGFIP